MRKYGYSGALATGTLAAGGTLGILVPPSIPLVVYAILTEQNIAKLFLAAFIPAGLAVIGFFIAIRGYIYFDPGSGPATEKLPLQRAHLRRDLIPRASRIRHSTQQAQDLLQPPLVMRDQFAGSLGQPLERVAVPGHDQLRLELADQSQRI